MSQQDQLLDQILSGRNRQLQLLAAQGLVPLPPGQLLALQIALTASPDREVASAAEQAILGSDPDPVVRFVEDEAGESELEWLAHHGQHPRVLEAVIRRRDVPRRALVALAPRLAAEQQEVLVLRQDAVVEEPEILVALERNPQLTSYARRRIWEYREHLLPQDKVPQQSAEEIAAAAEALSEAELREAIEEARQRAIEEGEEPPAKTAAELAADPSALTDSQIRSLPVPFRVRIARGASRQVRNILIRDSNTQVALSVISGNTLSDQEVEQIAGNRAVSADVLREVLRHREWMRKYNVAKALVKNPKTELSVAVRLISRLSVRDLRDLSRDRNVADGIRQTARRLYNAKQK